MPSALVVWGGWDGHQPEAVANLMAEGLKGRGFEVEMADDLAAFEDVEKLKSLDLLVPCWTMGEITGPQVQAITAAVRSGVGIGGVHGGMTDAFRLQCDYQFMVGGQFVAHPGGDQTEFTVEIDKTEKSPITEGLPDFPQKSEQYYMHMDPGVRVLARSYFDKVPMPVVWTKTWGKGRVFHCTLGHKPEDLEPETPRELLTRGLVWAAEGKAAG